MASTVTVAEPDAALNATEVAVTVTATLLAGGVGGAEYVVALPLAVADGAMVPQPGEQAVPLCVSAQVTPLFVSSLLTVAVNCCVAPAGSEAVLGQIETLMPRIVLNSCAHSAL